MRTFTKKQGKLYPTNESITYKKGDLSLNEDFQVALNAQNNVRDALNAGRTQINKNPGATSASIDLGKTDGQMDTNSGEGSEIKVPYNANGSQISAIQSMANKQNMDDVKLTIVKPNSDGTSQENESIKSDRIMEMRRNSIPFKKSELMGFLKSI